MEQLAGLGWTYCAGDVDDPAKTGRASFREVMTTLRKLLRALNLRDGQPWTMRASRRPWPR